MKKLFVLLITGILSCLISACAGDLSRQKEELQAGVKSEPVVIIDKKADVSLDKWKNENDWIAFYTFTEDEKLDAAWEAGAKAFGPTIGMYDLDGEGLKKLNRQVCGFEDAITRFEIADGIVTAFNNLGSIVFSHPYVYVTTIEDAIEGAAAYIYKTEDTDAEKYTYICITLPRVESEEGGVMTYFTMRYIADDYKSLFAENYNGVNGILASGETSESDLDYTIRLLYGAEIVK